jgi:hypothetical protein
MDRERYRFWLVQMLRLIVDEVNDMKKSHVQASGLRGRTLIGIHRNPETSALAV